MKFSSEIANNLDPQGFTEFFNKTKESATQASHMTRQAMRAHKVLTDMTNALKYDASELNLSENILSRVEDLIALVAGLSTSNSLINFLSIIHLYVRTHYTGSTSQKVWALVLEQFDFLKAEASRLMDNKSDKLDTQSIEEWKEYDAHFETLKAAVLSWKDVSKGDLVSNFANVVNILITLGFMPESEESEFRCGNFVLFRTRCWDIQKESVSFAEMCVDTFMFFLERGYNALKHKDVTLLMYPDKVAASLEKEYAVLVATAPVLDSGRLSDLGEDFKNDQDFEVRLEALIATIAGNLKREKNPHARTILTNRLVVLQKLRVSLMMAQKRAPLREKPYGVAIFGGSSVGKSHLNAVITKFLLHANGFPSRKENVVTLNDSDKFQSEYRSQHTAVCMDDHGNTKAEHYDTPPTAKIIDFLNNVSKAALNPNVELKGNVMIRPKLVTLTTNVKTLMAHTFSNEPVSILRRFNVFLDVKLRPEAVDPETGGLDGDKVTGMFDDCWSIDLQRVKIVRGSGNQPDTYTFEDIVTDATLVQCLQFMRSDSAKFYAKQKKFVTKTLDMFDQDLCPHSYTKDFCPTCSKLDVHGDEEWFNACAPLEDSRFDDVLSSQVEETIKNHNSVKFALRQWYKDRKIETMAFTTAKYEDLTEFLCAYRKEVMLATCAAIGVPIAVITFIRLVRPILRFHTQGSEETPPVKLDTDVPNPWKKVKALEIPRSIKGNTTTHKDLVELIEKRIAHIYLYPEGKGVRKRCCAVPMGNNFWLVPGHMLEEDEVYSVEFQTTRRDQLGNNFSSRFDASRWVRVGSDFALICIPNGIPNKDLSVFLVEDGDFELSSDLFGTMVYKDPDGVVTTSDVKVLEKKIFESKATSFPGISYNYPEATFPGLCMAPFVPKLQRSRILAFHLAGRNGTRYGVAGLLSRSDVEKGKIALRLQCPALACHSEGTFLTSKYGIDFAPCDEPSPRHAIKWLEDKDGSQPVGETYGAHDKGTVKFVSQVRKSPISDHVADIMGLPRIHGKPDCYKISEHWSRDLDLMTHPKGNFDPIILQQAFSDLKAKFHSFFDKCPEALKMVHPYPKDYVLGGMDGVTSVDRVDLNTSMGWPLNKKKKNFLQPVEREVEGITEPIDFEDPQFWAEVERMKSVLASGERIHVVHRGNLKDEPTKFIKKKIRVFAGCEFAFTCVVRQFYLPLVRVIQTYWKEFECAVGINAHGPQWDELTQYLTKFGSDRLIAGDYKAFDKSVSAEIMMLSFDVLISIAERAGYTKEQLTIMRGIATEICYPMYEYDGCYVQLASSNPSGHPLTVIINNLNNSFYERYAYYAMHRGEIVPPFAERVQAINYGDDNAMNVHPDEDKFCHTSMAHELGKVGITYTMADKDAESVPFQTLDEISFLKRGFRWNEELQHWVAPLEEASISKSLHNYIKRKGSDTMPEEIAAQSIKAANMEYFYHSRETFLKRREELQQVAKRAGIEAFVQDLPDYQDLSDRFTGSRKGLPVDVQPDVPLDTQSEEIRVAFAKEDPFYVRPGKKIKESFLIELVKSNFNHKPVVEDQPFGCWSIGCPDLIFEYGGYELIICVETKVLSNRATTRESRLKKVKEQTRRYTRAMSALKPDSMVLGLYCTEDGLDFEICFGYKEDVWKNFQFDVPELNHCVFSRPGMS